MTKSKFVKEAYKNIPGKKDGQRGSILCVVEVQIFLKALEASVGQITALQQNFNGVAGNEWIVQH